MAYTLGGAARAVGKSKPTIAKAIKSGRLPAGRSADGSCWQIDPSELHRVYPLAEKANGGPLQQDTPADSGGVGLLLAEKDARIADQAEVIADLRARLDLADTRLDRQAEINPLPVAGSRPRRWRWARWLL